MSSNRVIIDSNGRQFSSDSFERFGDDLCELILSYLSLHHKYIFQCVSKQWRRLVFNKQSVFIYKYSEYMYDNQNTVNLYREPILDQRSVNRSLRILLKKFPVKRFEHFKFIDLPLLEVLTDCCPQLESFAGVTSTASSYFFSENIFYPNLCNEAFYRFGLKFGQQMKRIVIGRSLMHLYNHEYLLVNMCPNLEELNFDNYREVDFSRLKPQNKLKKLILNYTLIENIFFDSIHRFSPQIKSLKLRITHSLIDNVTLQPSTIFSDLETFQTESVEMTDKFFRHLPTLMPNLKYLRMHGDFEFTDHTFAIVAKLRQLIQLSILTGFYRSHPYWIEETTSGYNIYELLRKCHKIKRIKVIYKIVMNNELLDKMCEIANNRPNDTIVLQCREFVNQNDCDLQNFPISKNFQLVFKPFTNPSGFLF